MLLFRFILFCIKYLIFKGVNPHNYRRWLYLLIHLSATFHLNDINSTPKACGFKFSKVYNNFLYKPSKGCHAGLVIIDNIEQHLG